MYNLRRFLYQNKNKIIKTIAIIVFIFIIIQVVNSLVKKKNEEDLTKLNNKTNIATNTESNNGLISNQSAITGQNVPKNELKSATTVINEFIEYCNKQELENAYNLLTDECKSQLYTSLEEFKQAYYRDVFNGQNKTCAIENWFGDTYKVNIMEDMMATGKVNDYSKQDYITVKNVNDEYKLNINNYIGYTQLNTKTTKDNISMEVICSNTYKEYEEYTIKVTNNMNNAIQLDDVNSTKTLYLEDSKGLKYPYYNHELTMPTLTVEAGQAKEVTIKFYSSYISTKDIRYIVFSNIISKDNQLKEKKEFRAKI